MVWTIIIYIYNIHNIILYIYIYISVHVISISPAHPYLKLPLNLVWQPGLLSGKEEAQSFKDYVLEQPPGPTRLLHRVYLLPLSASAAPLPPRFPGSPVWRFSQPLGSYSCLKYSEPPLGEPLGLLGNLVSFSVTQFSTSKLDCKTCFFKAGGGSRLGGKFSFQACEAQALSSSLKDLAGRSNSRTPATPLGSLPAR